MNRLILMICFVNGFLTSLFGQQAELTGHLELDSRWIQKIYVSKISDFNSMFTVSDKMIVAEGDIDTNGNFRVSFSTAEEETLYRVHVVKRNDPVSTLIIGSNDENHIFFIAKNSEYVSLNIFRTGKIIDQNSVKGDEANEELNILLRTIKSNDLSREELKDSLVAMADHYSSELVGLLAIHLTFGLNEYQTQKIKNVLAGFNRKNPYGSRIFPEYLGTNNTYLIQVTALFSFLFFGFASYWLYRKRKNDKIYRMLSQREVSIVRFILEGKTNKEIASGLNIELSTVKTHVNNIYSKLKVGSRKELTNYKNVFHGK